MIGTIRKHSKWMWMIIITVIVISFVFWGSQTGRNSGGGGSRPVSFGSINGKSITDEEFYNARREIFLHYFWISGGNWPDADARRSGFDVERETYYRLLLIRKI